MKKQKLELTWVGKEDRPRLEPRVLVEDPELSYHAEHKVTDEDIFDNRLIFGDNLLALKALEQEFAGKVKCIFIDPPYNTGSAFTHYDDGLEHSIWLRLMRARLELLRNLLTADGSLWISLDDNEAHYFKVLADELFGRSNFVSDVIWRSTDNSNNDAKQFSVDHNHIFVYSREPDWRSRRIPRKEEQKAHYSNPDDDPRGPWFDGNPISSPAYRENLCYDLEAPDGSVIKPPRNGWRWGKETMAEKIDSGEVHFTENFQSIRRRTYLRDQKDLPPSSLWFDLEETGHNRQAKYEQKKLFPDRTKEEWFGTPKPERLLRKIIHIASEPGDLVLDSFAGSGTTGAVAQKMGRRWIMVELGEHCHTHIIPRIKKVIDGEDEGGITKDADWKGGGGFRYYKLAPTLIQRDNYDNPVINPDYNPELLAEAMCKHMGFRYAPSDEVYWMHGQSTESDYIYVTTQPLTPAHLLYLSEEVGPDRSLFICCSAFRGKAGNYPNLTIKKIPKAVLGRCEFGRDDYSLEIKDLPTKEFEDEVPEELSKNGRARRKKPKTPDMFAAEGNK